MVAGQPKATKMETKAVNVLTPGLETHHSNVLQPITPTEPPLQPRMVLRSLKLKVWVSPIIKTAHVRHPLQEILHSSGCRCLQMEIQAD